jgi:hypothetical protein
MKKFLTRLLFTLMLIITIGILIVPVIISLLIWMFTQRGLLWIVRLIDWMFTAPIKNSN